MGKLFLEGLASVPARAVDRIRSSLQTLGRADLAQELERFVITEDLQRRFKMATRLVLALDQLSLSLIEPPTLASADLAGLQGCPTVRMSPGNVPVDPAEVRRSAMGGRAGLELLEYVRAQFDPTVADLATLVPLLTNSHLAPEVQARLGELPAERRLQLGSALVERRNRLLRQAGVALLRSCPGEAAFTALLRQLSSPCVWRDAVAFLRTHGPVVLPYALGVLDGEARPEQRREVARLLRLLQPGKDLAGPLRKLERDADPAVAPWATLALFEAGSADLKGLKGHVGDVEHHVLRVGAKVLLLRAGELDRKYLLAEFNGDDAAVHQLTLEALELLEPPEQLRVLEPLVQEALAGKNRATRKGSLEKLAGLHGPDAERIFGEAAFDADAEVAAVAKDRLVELRGFAALELFFDPWAAIERDPAELNLDDVHAINYYLLPRIPPSGDGRFAPYLAHLFTEYCASGRTYDYEQQLKPRLIDFGEPLVGALAEYLFVPDQSISLAAEDLLLHIGGPTAKDALSDFHSGTPPAEVAFRQLSNPATAEAARATILAEGSSTIPTLLKMLGDPKVRGEVLKILVSFKEPSTFPHLLRLLGNPPSDLIISGDISVLLRDTGFADRDITARLVELGEVVVEPLLQRLDDENWTVRYHAVLVLGRIGSARAIPALLRLMQREQASQEVVKGAIAALGAIGATEAVDVLAPYLSDPGREIRLETCAALGRIGNPAALAPLRDALEACKNLNEKRAVQHAIDQLKGGST